ncbi:MAG: alpha/beta fold hydrolase [Syntrophobacteraceae bacterium]|nr:alpha/beta fold hydrolase [Syntrophobacteraceae bacterium]
MRFEQRRAELGGGRQRGMARQAREPRTIRGRKALDVEDWVVVGHSYGGYLAQQYAVRYPDHLAGLVPPETPRINP